MTGNPCPSRREHPDEDAVYAQFCAAVERVIDAVGTQQTMYYCAAYLLAYQHVKAHGHAVTITAPDGAHVVVRGPRRMSYTECPPRGGRSHGDAPSTRPDVTRLAYRYAAQHAVLTGDDGCTCPLCAELELRTLQAAGWLP